MKISSVLLIAATLLLSACGSMIQKQNEENRFLVAAKPLEVDKLIAKCDPEPESRGEKISCVSGIIADSQEKCASFLDGLVLLENTSNTSLDIATTFFSALATVFVPLNTVHALSAAASVSSGTKNAINSNIYAKASIANFGQAIQATYYRDITDYRTQLMQLTKDNLNVRFEATRVQTIHRECSLASAEATIAATLTPTTSSDSLVTVTLTVTNASTDKNLKLTAVSPALVGSETLIITDNSSDKAVAAEIVDKINKSERLKRAKISAAASSTPDNKVQLTSPLSAAVQWIPSNAAVLVLSAVDVAGASPQGATGPQTTSVVDKARIPGRKID